MADLKNLKGKRKNKLGEYLKDDETSTVLEAPESAPASQNIRKAREKTGRTEPFGTRVSKEFLEDFKEVTFKTGLKKVELLEEALRAYKKINGL